MSSGSRKGAGRKPSPEHLKKIPYNTKLPRWLRDWLTRPGRAHSGPVVIERALRLNDLFAGFTKDRNHEKFKRYRQRKD